MRAEWRAKHPHLPFQPFRNNEVKVTIFKGPKAAMGGMANGTVRNIMFLLCIAIA